MPPPAWRVPSNDETAFEHDILVTFEATGDSEKTWVSEFAGVQGAGIVLRISTNLKTRQFQAILKGDPNIHEHFQSLGMTIDPKVGFDLPIKFDRDLLAQGFADEDLTEALEPLVAGLRHIIGATEPINLLLQAIRTVK